MSPPQVEIVSILIGAAALALALTPVAGRFASWSGLMDRPSHRSSHTRVTPRGGGLAVLAASASALSLVGGSVHLGPGEEALLGGVAALALTGLADDRFGLPAAFRLAVQTAVAAVFVSIVGGLPALPLPPPLDLPLGPLGAPAAVLWLVAVTNVFNFLDGIDGIAAAQAMVTGLGAAWAAWDPLAARVGAAVAGGSLGFLPYNWSPARIFLGDLGSLTLGYTLAALPFLAAPRSRSDIVFCTCMSLWLFLADATWTLARRVARGERWFEAHREHLYQRMAAAVGSHARVSGAIAVASAALTAMCLAVRDQGEPMWGWLVLAAAVALFVVELRLCDHRS
jgi:glycosyltransferase WbpL